MSNVTNQALESALTQVNNQLTANELAQSNTSQAAKLNLYYASGITERASNQLETDQDKANTANEQYNAAFESGEVCNNIVTAATAASTDAKNTASSVSTAATNIEGAAKALTSLWGDVMGVLAIATSLDNGSKVQKLVKNASDETELAARAAENTTLQSLQTTIEASQTQAASMLTQAKTLDTDIKSLVGVLDSNLTTLQGVVANDVAQLTQAQETENNAEGTYRTAAAETDAMENTLDFINEHVNHDLAWEDVKDEQGYLFNISFDAYEEVAIDPTVLMGTKSSSSSSGSAATPEKIIKEYRIIFVPQDMAPTFNINQAKSTELPSYFPIKPDGSKTYTQEFSTAEYHHTGSASKPPVALDYSGKALELGTSYAFFVYIDYTCDYQNEMEDTDGYLSLPSPYHTLQIPLPTASKPNLLFFRAGKKCKTADGGVRVAFKISNEDLTLPNSGKFTDFTEFRVFLFDQKNQLSGLLNDAINIEVEKMYELETTVRLDQAAVDQALQAYNTAIATGAPADVVEKLRQQLEAARTQLTSDRAAYEKQVKIVEEMFDLKINNFVLDEDILNDIPDAYGLIAAEFDPSTLLIKIDETKGIIEILDSDIADQTKAINANNKAIGDLQKSIKKHKEDQAKVLKDAEDGLRKAIEDDTLLQRLLNAFPGSEGKLIEFILKGVQGKLTAKEIQLYFILMTIFSEDERKALSKAKTDYHSLQISINAEETMISDFQYNGTLLNAEMDYLKNEKKEEEAELKRLQAEYDLFNTSESSASKSKSKSKKKAKDAAAAETEEETETGNEEDVPSKPESDSDYTYFMAYNDKGDFTDNFGEPMMQNHFYCALVYSVVKESSANVAPMYAPAMSEYSKPKMYFMPTL